MSVINNIAKSWIDRETDALEEYKYANEGDERTSGSYYLTFKKSLATVADEDPEMFEVEAMSRVTPVAVALVAGVAIGTVGVAVVNKIKKHVQDKKNKKRAALEAADEEIVEEKEN